MVCLVEVCLVDFCIKVDVVNYFLGLVIICFELNLVLGVKVVCIFNLLWDFVCLFLMVVVCVVEVIFGKFYVGLELLNKK